jgi:hypothetical protein
MYVSVDLWASEPIRQVLHDTLGADALLFWPIRDVRFTRQFAVCSYRQRVMTHTER